MVIFYAILKTTFPFVVPLLEGYFVNQAETKQTKTP